MTSSIEILRVMLVRFGLDFEIEYAENAPETQSHVVIKTRKFNQELMNLVDAWSVRVPSVFGPIGVTWQELKRPKILRQDCTAVIHSNVCGCVLKN